MSIVFGPKGCGKTQLAQVLTSTYSNDHDVHVVYIGFKSEENVVRSEIVTKTYFKDIRKKLRKYGKDIILETSELFGIPKIIAKIGTDILYHLYDIFREEKKIKPKQSIIIVDEFRVVGNFNEVRRTLEINANEIRNVNNELKNQGSSIKTIYFTSDATAIELQLKIGSKCDWYIMWNLPMKPFFEILDEVRCPERRDIIWKLTGGNPREIVNLLRNNWNLKSWIADKTGTVSRILENYLRNEGKTINQVLQELCEGINVIDKLSQLKIWNYLLEGNIVMKTNARFRYLSGLFKEEWIGKDDAFQLPVYYW